LRLSFIVWIRDETYQSLRVLKRALRELQILIKLYWETSKDRGEWGDLGIEER
jgi:hypothetical protein